VIALMGNSLEDVRSSASSSDETETSRAEALLGELELLRVLASLGTSIAVFSHEVRSALNGAHTSVDLLALRADAENERDIGNARRSIRRLQEIATYIDSYVSNSRRRQRVAQPMDRVLGDFVNQFCANFSIHVDVQFSVEPPGLRTAPMTRSELDAVLINLYTNAIKAMDDEDAAGRRVRITATAEAGMVSIRVKDTGRGIDPSVLGEVFDAFVSPSRAAVSELGAGSGLGLKIVSDIADDYGGSVELADPDASFTTCVLFRVPQWEPQVTPVAGTN